MVLLNTSWNDAIGALGIELIKIWFGVERITLKSSGLRTSIVSRLVMPGNRMTAEEIVMLSSSTQC